MLFLLAVAGVSILMTHGIWVESGIMPSAALSKLEVSDWSLRGVADSSQDAGRPAPHVRMVDGTSYSLHPRQTCAGCHQAG